MPQSRRVVAIQDSDKEEVRVFGFGEYVGEEMPPKGTPGVFGLDMGELGISNPKIVLDDGGIVWGAQCWWGDEKKFMDEMLKGRKIVIVPLPVSL